MLQIAAPKASLIVALIALVAGLTGWFGRGFAFLLQRWWTGAPKREDAAYLNSVADLAAKLKANGTTLDEVRQFEKIMRKPSLVTSTAATEVLEANLEKTLVDLRLLLSEEEIEALDVAQERWNKYRTALEVCAGLEFKGGTHAPLAGLMAGLTETERRTTAIRAQVEERAAR